MDFSWFARILTSLFVSQFFKFYDALGILMETEKQAYQLMFYFLFSNFPLLSLLPNVGLYHSAGKLFVPLSHSEFFHRLSYNI